MSLIVTDLRTQGRTPPPAASSRGEHNAWVANAREAAERAAAAQVAEATATLYWAVLKRGGQTYQKATRNAGVARGWHAEPKLAVLQCGTGVPPWEADAQAPRATPPAVPATSSAELAPGDPVGPSESTGMTTAAAAPATHGPAQGRAPAGGPVEAPAAVSPALIVDQVLNLLENSDDLRISKHATAIKKYRECNARGEYRWPRFTRKAAAVEKKKEPGF